MQHVVGLINERIIQAHINLYVAVFKVHCISVHPP